MKRLENKIAVVTGAASGIGQAVAIEYAKQGADVAVVDRDEVNGQKTVDQIKELGQNAVFVKVDLRSPENIAEAKNTIMQSFERIDILFNAAGVLVHKPFLEQTMNDLDLIFETNFRAYVCMMQQFIPVMVEQGKGAIVNVASISAVWPELNSYFYGAMKAAVTNMSRNVAKEFSRKGVRINCILPGPINTNMTPDAIKESKELQQELIDAVGMLNRLGEPQDIANAAVYLASDEASFVTGIDLIVDGGVCISN